MKPFARVILLASIAAPVAPVFGGTVITNNLPANTAIININAVQDGAALYNGDQSLWYQPFYTGGATQLLGYSLQSGTYSFRVINPEDASQLFPTLTPDQTNQIFSAWSYNTPWLTDFLVFGGAAATKNSIPQIFDGSPDPGSYDTASTAYHGAVIAGYFDTIRTGAAGRKSTTLTNAYTFATATNLIFAVPDYGLGDNHGGVSVLIAPAGTVSNAVVKIWTGAADQNWFNANNWSPTGVPDTNDIITVFTSGTINLASPVTIAGVLNWSGGTFAGAPITIRSNGVMNLIGNSAKSIDSTLTNAGTVAWLAGDIGVFNNGGSLSGRVENLAGGLWDIQCDRNMYNAYGNPTSFHNAGTVQKSAGTGTTTFSIAFHNAGTVTVQTGVIDFNGGGTIESVFNADASAAIHFNSGAFTYSTVPTLNGPGAIQLSGGTLTLLDDQIPGLQMTGGTISLSPAFQGGVITNLTLNGSILNGSYTVAGTVGLGNGVSGNLTVTNGGTVNWSGGNITGVLNVDAGATLNWSGGSAQNVVKVENNGALNLMGSNAKNIEGALTNAGTVTWLAGDIGVFNNGGSLSGRVENLAGGLWDIQCDRNMYNAYGNPTSFHNAGTVQKSAGTGTTTFSIAFHNAGTVTVQTGVIDFNGGGTIESVFNADAGAAIHFNSGAFTYSTVPTLNGPGAIQLSGGTLTLLDDQIPGLQMTGGTISLSPAFQGGVITNLTLNGSILNGSYTVAGTVGLGNGVSGNLTVTNGGTVNWSGGNITGVLNVDAGATLNWSGGSAQNVVKVENNGALNLMGSNAKNIEGALTNAGTVTWLAGNIGVFNNGGSLSGRVDNLPGALWDIQCDRNMYNAYGNPTSFYNAGTVQKSAGTGTTTFSIAFHNAGTVTVQTGVIEFNGGGTIESVFNAGAGTAIHFNSGAFTYSTVPTLNGPGAIQLTGGTLTLLDDVIPGLQMAGGTLTLSPTFQNGTITNLTLGGALSGDYTVSGTLTLGNGDAGTLTVLNGATLNWNGGNVSGLVLEGGGTVNWNNGTLLGALDILGNAVVNWSGGSAQNVVKVENNGALNFTGSNMKYVEGALTNAGTVIWVAGNIGIFNNGGSLSGQVENLPGALWDVQCDRNMYNAYGNPTSFHNAGTVQKSAGSGTTTFAIAFNNSGALDVETGLVNFSANNTYAQTGATLQFGLRGPGSSGQVHVAGNMAFDGTLAADLASGYAPKAGDTFSLVTYDSHSGSFNNLNLPALDPGLGWQVSYNSGAALIQAVSNANGSVHITGLVSDGQGHGVTNLTVFAYATNSVGIIYLSTLTDGSGHYSLGVSNATWSVGLQDLPAHGFDPVANQNVPVNGADQTADFVLQPYSGQLYSITTAVNPSGAGTAGGGGTFAPGSLVTLTAAANTNALPFYFLSWTENGVFESASSAYSFPAQRNRQLTANFTLPTFTMTVSNNPPDAGVVLGARTNFYGETNLLTAQPNFGYGFSNWSEGASVLGTDPVLKTVMYTNHVITANYVEVNLAHVVTTATLPPGVATVSGAGTYSNNQTATFSAPASVTIPPDLYTFQKFTLSNALVSTSASFSKTFATTDPTNLQYVAVYSTLNVVPQITNTLANYPNPVPATTNLVLTFRFDRTMDTNFMPTVWLTNSVAATQPTVPGAGHWSNGAEPTDTYITPAITFVTGMDGTNRVFISSARDLNGDVLAPTNTLNLIVDATPPVLTGVSASPTVTTAGISWSSDEAASSQVEFGPTTAYGSLSSFYGQLVKSHAVTLTGLNPDSPYHFRVRSRDLAGNEALSADQTFATLVAPDLQVANLSAAGAFVSGGSILIGWVDTNSGAGATYTSWYDRVIVTNTTTGQTLLNTALRYDAPSAGDIPGGGSRSRQFTFNLPNGPDGAGALQILVTANVYNNLAETSRNNNTAMIQEASTLPDYPDLQVANLMVTNAALKSGDTVGIEWLDNNTGSAAVGASFQDRVTVVNQNTAQTLVNAAFTYNANVSGSIGAGESASRQFSFKLPDGNSGAGNLLITVTADGANNIFEYNAGGSAESNNTNSVAALSTLADYADLTVTNIVAPASAGAGDTVQVVWTDANLGSATAVHPWSDQVFLADTAAVNAGQWLASFQITNDIPAGGSLAVTQHVTLPAFVAGNQWIIVKANASGSFFETNTVNNSVLSAQPVNVGATLTLSLTRATVSESDGANALTATVSRNGGTGADLALTLSTDATGLNLPSTVTIPAGQHSAAFTVGVVDQFIAGGSATVNLSASATGFPTANAPVTILYNDAATLALTVSTNAVPENAAPGAVTGLVTRNVNLAQPVTVTLISDLPSALTVPATVNIPAGQASATFDLTPVNDNIVTGTRRVHVSAGAAGLSAVSATIDVLNVNTVDLSLRFASDSVPKGAPSPATIGTVSRKPVSPAAQNVFLSVPDNSLVTVPSVVTIPANADAVSFNVNVGDDQLATGPQTATVVAQALTPSNLVNSNGQASATLTILDTHGPTLSVSFAEKTIAKGSNTVATVTRNTPATNALSVALTASPGDAVTLPAAVLIPDGQASATFTVTGVLDNKQTGPRQVALTASATGFNSGVGNLTVSDIYLPDLAPVSVIGPSNALTSQKITLQWTVLNKGLADANGTWYDYVYLAADNLGQNATLMGFETNTVPLAIGASYTNQTSIYLPNAPGNYWVVIKTDAGNTVGELNEQNNSLVAAAPLTIDAAYRATLTSATPNIAASGTPIVLAGRTFDPRDDSPVALVPATVRVLVKGTRRVFSVYSDANGDFSYTFQPLANEAGDYNAGADYPLIQTDSNQVSFALLGMRSQPGSITTQLLPDVPATNRLVLTNLTAHALTGLAVSLPDLQGSLEAQFNLTNTTLPPNGTLTVDYTLQSALTHVAQLKFAAQVTSSEGAQVGIPVNVTVVPLTAQLTANPAYLNRGILVGTQTLVSFDIVNTGGAASGDLTLQLPATLPWITLSSPAIVPSIPPGGKATVTLALDPPADLPLTLYTGNLAAANNNTGLNVPFQFRAMSTQKGDLRVTATDDYTYYVAGAPKVTNAIVTVRDAITTQVIAQTNSDANGVAYFAGLPEGPYTVDATAPKHNQFRASASVVTGTTNDLEAFMPRQLVTYQWSVVPTEIQDEYKIQLESVFETEVPVPNVVVEEPEELLFVFPGSASQFQLKLRNEGLIAAKDVRIQVPDDPVYLITPLVTNVGVIPAQSELSIPVKVELREAPAGSQSDVGKLGISPCGISVNDPCHLFPKIPLDVYYDYNCGDNTIVQKRSAQMDMLCTAKNLEDRIKQCLNVLNAARNSDNVAAFGCSALADFLSCIANISLDPCVKAALDGLCGAREGVLGALGGALPDLPECICAHLPNIPLPSFPSGGASGGGFGNYPILPTGGYYASGNPVVTAIYIPGNCSGAGPASLNSHTVTQVIATTSPLRISAPIKASAGGVCAHVRLRINQDVVLTRTAFTGTLEIDNGGDAAITGIQVSLDFRDATNGVAADKFVTEGPVLSTLTAVDGGGSLAGGASGSAVYTFIPTLDAAPDAPETFQIGGTLSYIDNGEPVVVPLLSAPITVYPEAKLDLVYFQQRDVYGDDPFTLEIEPSEPFALGLIVKNVGAGNAHNFRITSGQPQIVDNEKGLLIDFNIIGTEVGDQPISPTLSANLGDIDPGGTKEVTWEMLSTLQGKFISFNATFQHVNDLGVTNTSLIQSVEIHELIHKVLANRPGDDDVPDFLVNDIPDPDHLPDTLYLNDGSEAPVAVFTNATIDGLVGAGHTQVQLTASVSNGWNYLQVPDPGVGFRLDHVVRSDGKIIALTNNIWTTDRSFPASSTGAVRENLLHILDSAGTGAYTLYYRSTNTTAPQIVQLGPVVPFTQPGAVSSVNVVFSEPVDLATFDSSALTLTRNGGANLITPGSGISITLVSNATYSISGLDSLTAPDGDYELTLNASGIDDLWGNNAGNASASVQWTKGNAPVVVQTLDAVSPNPRNVPVTTVNVTFSKAINPATFDSGALSLTLNGGPNLIAGDVFVTPVSGNTFAISGLGTLTAGDGNYQLTVDAAAIQDSGGVPGFGSKSASWTMVTTPPRIVALEQLATNPRNIVVRSLNVTFAQPIDPATFDYQDVTLTRDSGANLVTSDVTVKPVNSTTYQIANFNWVVGQPGTYTLTVNAAGIADLAGNIGSGSTNESWQMILETPPSPTDLAITPDTGISASDGLTRTNPIVLFGTLGASNLAVRVTDQSSGVDFGSATVSGTNFSESLTFTAEGEHRLKVTAVDVAGNVSSPAYFDLFLDSAAPTAGIQPVSPNPTSAPVTNLLVTFSEAINTNTISAANFVLTRNGTNAATPAVSIVSSNQVLVTGLTGATASSGAYVLTLDLSGIQDLAGNSSSGTVSTAWQNVPANQPPVIVQEPNATAQPGSTFQRLIQASDPEGNQITFSLAATAPAGALITTNGLLSWTPACEQGGTTNYLTVWATDNGVPPASNAMTFAVSVGDCVQVAVGSAIAQVGTTGSVPVTVFSSAGVTNLSFVLAYPSNRFANWAVAPSNSVVATATAQALNASQAQFNLDSKSGQSFQGSALLGSISFVPLPGRSAFVPLTLTNAAGTKSDGSLVSSAVGGAGRVVVIGAEPLLEAKLASNSQRQLILYGNPGASYQLASSTQLGGTNWTLLARVPMTNLTETLAVGGGGPQVFYRAWEFSANPPILELSLSGPTNASLLLYGQPGRSYSIESATNLLPEATWVPITNLFLTNSFLPVRIGNPTNRTMFFRANP